MTSQTSPSSDATILLPETISRRKLPVNLKAADFNFFSHELERAIPPTRLLERYDVGVSAEGILFQRGRILPESFAVTDRKRNVKLGSLLKFLASNYLVKKRRRFEQDGIWVVDDWSSGYFHWVTDVIPKLFMVRERLKDSVLLLPGKFQELEFVRGSLQAFSIGAVEFIDVDEVLFCRKLIIPTPSVPTGNYNDELIRRVRDLMVGFYGGDQRNKADARVYLSRALAPKRRILNEDEIIEVLGRFGFRTVRTEEHSFQEQVRIASGARYLVSNHGAGLTNILFMSAGSSVLELRHSTDSHSNCYFSLASPLDLNYFYQTCEPQRRDEDSHTANLIVNAPELQGSIELMLSYRG